MAESNLDKILKKKQIEYNNRKKVDKYNIETRTNGVVRISNPDISSRKPYGNGSYRTTKEYKSAVMPESDFIKVISKNNPYAPTKPFNISKEITGVTSFQNVTVQQNVLNAQKLLNLKEDEAYLMFALDTEWLGAPGKPSAPQAVYEIGMVPMLVTKDGVSVLADGPMDQNNILNLGLGLDKTNAKAYKELLIKLENNEFLDSDEQRTLKDLASLGNKVSIDADGVIKREKNTMLMSGQDLFKYKEEIERGITLLSDPQNKAIQREVVASRIVKEVNERANSAPFKAKNIKGTMFLMHNADNADIPALKETFGAESNFFKMIEGNTIDTYALTKATTSSIWDIHENTLGPVRGPGTQRSMASVYAPYLNLDDTAHIGGEDAFVLANNAKGMFESPRVKESLKDIRIAKETFGIGDELYSVNTVFKKPGTYDNVYYLNKYGKFEAREGQFNAVNKRKMHRIVNFLEYDSQGKKQYGLVLYNLDDEVYSMVTRNTVDELISTVQQNFKDPTKVKGINLLRKQDIVDNARYEYEAMFHGDGNEAFNKFNMYFNATKKVIDNPDTSFDAKALGLTDTQFKKFQAMLPRLKEEMPFYEDFKANVLDKLENDAARTVALKEYYKSFESIAYGSTSNGSTVLKNRRNKFLFNSITSNGRLREPYRNMSAEDLSKYIISEKPENFFGRVYNPFTREYSITNLNSVDNLAKKITRIVSPTSTDASLISVDVLENLKEFVIGARNEGQIETSKAKKLLSIMNRAKFDQGIGRNGLGGVHELSRKVASEILGDVAKWNADVGLINIVEDTQKMKVGKITNRAKKIEELNKNVYQNIMERAKLYYPKEGEVLAFRNPKIVERLSAIDQAILNQVNMYASDNVLKPTPIVEQLANLANNFRKNDRNMVTDFSMTDDGTGLILSIYDGSLSEGTQKRLNISIPMLDPQTGLITFRGQENANPLRLHLKYNRNANIKELQVDTYANKVIDTLSTNKAVETITRMVKENDIERAQSYAEALMKGSLSAIPKGAYNQQELNDMVVGKGSRKASIARSAYLDYNDLIYDVYKTKYGSLSQLTPNKQAQLLREITYADSMVGSIPGGITSEGAELRYYIKQAFGNNYHVAPLKAERFQAGYLSLIDARRFGMFGTYSDVNSEKPRQALNYMPMSINDYIKVDSNGKLVTRSEALGRYASETSRIFDDLGGTRLSLGIEEKSGYNFKTLFVNDFEIRDIMEKQKGREGVDALNFARRPHVHDDTILMKASAAELMGVMQQKNISLDSDIDASYLALALKEAENPLVLRNGETTIGYNQRGKAIKYDGKYDAVLDDVIFNENTGKYELRTRQIRPGEAGMKVMGLDGGNKGTVRIFSDKEWLEYFGEQYKDIEVMANFKTSKIPGDVLASQMKLLVSELDESKAILSEIDSNTVGKQTKQDIIKGKIDEVLLAGFNTKTANEDDAVKAIINAIEVREVINNGRPISQIIMPDDLGLNLNPGNLIKKTGEILNEYTGKSNIIEGHLYGLATFGRADVPKIHSITTRRKSIDDGVKIGIKEIESLNTRKLFNKNIKLDNTIERVKNLIRENGAGFQEEKEQVLNALRYGDRGLIENMDSYSVVRTKGIMDKRGIDRYFDELSPLSRQGDFSEDKIANTIFDRNMFGGKNGFFLELPDEIDIGGRKLDKIFMPILNPEKVGEEYFLNDVQKIQRSIFDNISIYRSTFDANNKMNYEKYTQDEILKLRKESYDALFGIPVGKNERRGGLIRNYYKELGNAVFNGDGIIGENIFSTRVDASAKLTFAAVSPNDQLPNYMKNKIDEGSVLLARADLEQMLGKLGKKDIKEQMRIASTTGITGIGIRYPNMQPGAVQPVKYRVLSAKEEREALRDGYDFSGKAYVTVGSQKRWGADFDGDAYSGFFPQLAGDKVRKIDPNIQKELDSWFEIEKGWMEKVAQKSYDELANETKTIYQAILETGDIFEIDSVSDDLMRAIEVESRAMKNVGSLSNLNTKYRRITETIGKMTNDETLYPIQAFFGQAYEQLPISAKRVGEDVLKMLKDEALPLEIRQGQAKEMFTEFVNNYVSFVDAASELDVEKMMETSKGLGFWDLENGMKFKGTVKGEEVQANVMLGRGAGEELSYRDVEEMLYKLKGYGVDKETLNDPFLLLGVNNPSSGEKALDMISALDATKGKGKMFAYSGSDIISEQIFGETLNAKEAANAFNQRLRIHQISSGIDGMTNTRTLYDTVPATLTNIGDETLKKMMNTSVPHIDNLGGSALKIGGATIAGLWAVGRVFGGVGRKKDTQEHGRADQAPSSDGEYIDPIYYAGAPPGTEPPTARVIENGSGYQRVNISIDGNAMTGLTNEEIANLVSNEVQRQSGLNMNININSQDDRTSMDRTWLQQQFASVLNSGYAY